MYKWPSNSLSHRLIGKLSALLSTARTYCYAPHKLRSADIHLLLQSPAQKAAQAALCAQNFRSGTAQKVLIVIPFRDKWNLTAQCLTSLAKQHQGPHKVLIALVDNSSQEKSTAEGIASALAESTEACQIRHLRYETDFNFSALNNWAVRDCSDFSPDIVFLCNNDIEFLEPDSLLKLVSFTRDQTNAGAVGCTLIYPDRKVQHLFVYVGSKIVGSHPHKGRPLKLSEAWYQKPRPVGAVTGAITLLKTSVYREVEGLDETLPTSYQDVDLCLKLQAKGYVNWVVPDVVMIHHETQTRSKEPSWGEAYRLYERWGQMIWENPFVHPGLNRRAEHYVLRVFTKGSFK